MAISDYNKDTEGNIITKPLTGWDTAAFAGVAIMLGVQYADSLEQLESGRSTAIAFALKPQQCLDLGEALTRAANKLLNQTAWDQPLN